MPRTQRIKLAAGSMILYPATTLLRVAPVTRGERIASFFWIQSMVRDDGHRRLLFDLDLSIRMLTRRIAALRDNPACAELAGRPPPDGVDRAAGGVAAEQGALRPAQHFDPFDVDGIANTHADPRPADPVDKQPDRHHVGRQASGNQRGLVHRDMARAFARDRLAPGAAQRDAEADADPSSLVPGAAALARVRASVA